MTDRKRLLKNKYGEDYFAHIGRMGGEKGKGGGFRNNPELAREAGKKSAEARRKRKEEENAAS